jgi:hypothetical protein
MLRKILLVLVVVVLVFVVAVSMQPADFRVERTTTIAAPAPAVFAQVNDFHNWQAWSPWAKLDPTIQTAYEGPPAGPGAIYTWSGNSKVGAGRMTILASHPSDLVSIRIEFLKPFSATNTADFTFQPAGNQTVVTWSMTGKNNFVSKTMGMFVSMDKMIGGDFEKGLAQMKAVAETAPKQ